MPNKRESIHVEVRCASGETCEAWDHYQCSGRTGTSGAVVLVVALLQDRYARSGSATRMPNFAMGIGFATQFCIS